MTQVSMKDDRTAAEGPQIRYRIVKPANKNVLTNKITNDKIPNARTRAASFNNPTKPANNYDNKCLNQKIAFDWVPGAVDLIIPTFGNWKKQNIFYKAESNQYDSLNVSKNKVMRFPQCLSSERRNSNHPKIPKNCKFLSKFCSNELNRDSQTKILPIISKTEKVLEQKFPNSHRIASKIKMIELIENREDDCLDLKTAHDQDTAQSTKQSCEIKHNSKELKKEFMRIYLRQKERYQTILDQNGISAQVKDEEFREFMLKFQD